MDTKLTQHREGVRIFTPLSGHFNGVHNLPLVVIGEGDPYRIAEGIRPDPSYFTHSDAHREGDVLSATVYEFTWVDALVFLQHVKKHVAADFAARQIIGEAQYAINLNRKVA
jgi:hypothetical protein